MSSTLENAIAGATAASRGAGIVFRGVENRARLAALELEEERSKLVRFTAGLVALVSAVFATLMAGTALYAAVFWDSPHRVAALAFLAAGEFVLAVCLAFWIRHRWRIWRPLAETREQLRRDHECIRDLFTSREGATNS